ncbi:hypothetical protein FNF27_01665 [Cafeteria roenbergensis]|uniref:Methyltransferase domain-containing protein n=1 Tax=Cafeteria roenbergensis TaxID=33653 RepID=A0A5A8EG26_CAFRO|nr:hypothetical protein FNF27_01665 [Cafeteria roenbergensis]
MADAGAALESAPGRRRRPGTGTTDVAIWDAYHSGPEPPPWESGSFCSHLAAALPRAKVAPGATALEIGCGGGQNTVYLATQGLHTAGVDVSRKALARAATNALPPGVVAVDDLADLGAVPGATGSVCFHHADVLKADDLNRLLGAKALAGGVELLFDTQTFHVLREVDEAGAAAAYARLVAPGGKLIMLCGAVGDPERTEPGPPALTKEEATGAICAAGFRLDACSKVRFDSTPTYGAVPPLAWLVEATRE